MAELEPATKVSGGEKGKSLAYYAVAFMALSTVLLLTGMLGVSFWLSRPQNFSPETDRLADLLDQLILDNYVPAANIERGQRMPESIEKDDRLTRWTSYEFKVTLPPQLNIAGFKAQIRKDMSTHFVKVLDEEQSSEAAGHVFSLYYENLPFARLTLIPGQSSDSASARSDLRYSSSLLADLAEETLAAVASPARPIRSAAEEREDLNAFWRYTAFTVELPPGLTLGSLKGQLEARNNIPDVVVSTDPQLEPSVNLLVTIAGKPCVGITGILAEGNVPERPEPLSLTGAMQGTLDGSEPSEEPGGIVAPVEEGMVVTPVDQSAIAPTETGPAYPMAQEGESQPVKEPRDTSRPGLLAIIIDDGGNSAVHSERFLALDNRLTLAILPNTPVAVDTAERGAALGFEIMLHMPMETESATEEAVPGTLFTAMGKDEIQKLTNAALDQIPHVVGINNHTGSKFTSNKKKMGFCLEVLKERGLFFIDSVTTGKSVAYETAVEMKVPAARRDVFLDNVTTEASVRSQFEVLLSVVQKHGIAIGIGHFQSPATAKVLAEEIPKLAGANIELVHASELVQ